MIVVYHRKSKSIQYPLDEIEKIYKGFKEKEITSRQAVISIIDWMQYFDHDKEDQFSSFEEKMFIEKGIEIITEINPRIKEFYTFLEGIYFSDFIKKEEIVKLIKNYFPKKYVNFLGFIEKIYNK